MSDLKRTNKGSYYSRQLFDEIFLKNSKECDYTVLIGRETDKIKHTKQDGGKNV